MLVTYEDIRNDESIKCYITEADRALSALGYTEHSFPHVVKAATMAEMILLTLNYPKRTAELAITAPLCAWSIRFTILPISCIYPAILANSAVRFG